MRNKSSTWRNKPSRALRKMGVTVNPESIEIKSWSLWINLKMQGWNRQTDMTPVSFVSESIESSTMVGKESALNHLLTGNDIKVTFRLIPETNSSWICVAGRSLSASLALRPRERRWWQLFARKCAHSFKTYRFNTINKKTHVYKADKLCKTSENLLMEKKLIVPQIGVIIFMLMRHHGIVWLLS